MYVPINVRMMTFIMFNLFNIFYNPQAISSLQELILHNNLSPCKPESCGQDLNMILSTLYHRSRLPASHADGKPSGFNNPCILIIEH